MVKTRRSSHTCSPSLVCRAKRRAVINATSPQLKATHGGLTRKEVVWKILTRIFLVARQGYWYRVLPTDGIEEDITHATSIEWEYLLPMFTFVGLLSWKVTSMVKECSIEDCQWDIFQQSFEKHGKLHLSTLFIKKSRVRFFCVGKPVYSGPLKQIKANIAFLCLTHRDLEKRALRADAKIQAAQLIARRQYNRTMRKDQQIIDVDGNEDNNEEDNGDDIPVDTIDRIALEVERQIQVAESLNLHFRPRLSRCNTGKSNKI